MSHRIALQYSLFLFITFFTLGFCAHFSQNNITNNVDVSISSKNTKEIISKDGMKMILIPTGEFIMGSNESDDEKPIHTVYLDAFYMDIHEVTNEQYQKFMSETRHPPPIFWKKPEFNDPKHPVIGVGWEDANAYAKWAGKRLPTEAEWEYAARGGLVGKRFVWGDDWPPPKGSGNFADETAKKTFTDWHIISVYNDGYVYTAPVGSFTQNGYGLYDMVGNVWEWCMDWYSKDFYAISPKQNPIGPSSGEGRVVRGGSWTNYLIYDGIRVADRYYLTSASYPNVGFRCVK